MLKQICGVGLADNIKIELTNRLYKGTSHVIASTFACIITTLIELLNYPTLSSWILFLLTIGASTFRLVLFPLYHVRAKRSVLTAAASEFWSKAFCLGAMLLAFCVMLGIIQAFHDNEIDEQTTLFVLSLGMSAGTAMRMAVQPWVGITTSLIVLPVLSYCNIAVGDEHHMMLGFFAIIYIVVVIVNIVHGYAEFIESIKSTQEVERLASHDKLTGLLNRLGFGHAFSQARVRSIARKTLFSLLLIDLDRFKAINDIYGHGAGDALLVEVGLCLRELAAGQAIIARLGGDEFAIIKEAGASDAAHLASKVVERLQRRFRIDGKNLEIGSSIGVTCCADTDNITMDEMLKTADFALYKAKNGGRNQYIVFDPQMLEEILDKHRLEVSLNNALENGELSVVYQPLVEVGSHKITGVEAFVRWNHPEMGAIPPSTFIPIAEDLGIIGGIGSFVLETACREVSTWNSDVTLAVNVSPLQFAHGDLPDKVFRILAKTNFAASRLELEITEGVLLDAHGKSKVGLEALRACGVRISLDDFGAGWASIGYLWRYTFDKIKIDQSFVVACASDNKAAAIVRGIISLAHGLELPVVAEGVETTEQVSLLYDMGCSQMQGYLFGKPVSGADAKLLVQARRANTYLKLVENIA